MKTLLDILALSTDYLQQRGIENSRRQAEDLMCDALKMQRIHLYQEFDRPLSELELETCRQYLARRAKGEPLQYIHGQVEFYGCQITVNKNVLIPRQETEILVDLIVKQLQKENLEDKVLWDICCGSGCIGIALKKKFPQLKVMGSDLSSSALEVAKNNAALNEVQVEFLKGDLLNPFIGNKVNFLVCNPPYISEEDFFKLDREVRDYEPSLALVGGITGLEFYDRLRDDLKTFLAPQAKVWFEIGNKQGSRIYDMFSQLPGVSCRFDKDWAGHDRFFFLENE